MKSHHQEQRRRLATRLPAGPSGFPPSSCSVDLLFLAAGVTIGSMPSGSVSNRRTSLLCILALSGAPAEASQPFPPIEQRGQDLTPGFL